MVEDGSEIIKQKLAKGELDFAVFASTTMISSDHLEIHHLLSLPFTIALSPEHPLAGRKEVSFHEVSQEKFVIYNKNFAHNKGFHQACQTSNSFPQVIAEVSDISIVKSYIKKEGAVGFMVQSANNRDILYLPLSDSDLPNFNIYLAYPKNNPDLEEKLLGIKDKIIQTIQKESKIDSAS